MERSIDFVCGRTYDKNGNILSMKRKGRKGFPITSVEEAVYDDLSFAYDGNQLVAVADVAIGIEAVSKDGIVSVGKSGMQFADGVDEEEEYGYDANSNMVSDKNKGIGKIAYNTLNLPETVAFSGDDDIFNYQFWLSPIARVNTVNFTYAADGTKLKSGYVTYKEVSAVQPARTNAFLPDSLRFGGGLLDSTRVIGPGTGRTFWLREVNTVTYAGNYQYENDTLSKKFFADGYIDCSGGEPVACFYLKDHLGNVRMVVDENGGIVQVNAYYPFGALYGSGTGDAAQRYKYNGKELDRMHGLDWYDYGARWMDPVLCRFTTMDPLCEKYYDTSPYAYCANNPVKYVDPDGKKVYGLDESARRNIVNTLTEEEGKYVSFSDDGLLDVSLLNQYSSKSMNFIALKTLANSDINYKFVVSDTDVDGEKFYNGTSYYTGLTAFPNETNKASKDNDVWIYTSSLEDEKGQTKTTAHEAYGHAYFYELKRSDESVDYHHRYVNVGKLEWDNELQMDVPVLIRVDSNEKLKEQIDIVTKQALINYDSRF